MGYHTLKVDEERNRLYLTLTGLMTDDETRIAADACIEAVKKLRPGFHIINDISQFRPLTKEGVTHVKRAGEFCAKSGMKATVRVVGISPTVHQQFQRAARESGYTAYTAQSVEEAEAMLDAHQD
jgi:hypothetical protein